MQGSFGVFVDPAGDSSSSVSSGAGQTALAGPHGATAGPSVGRQKMHNAGQEQKQTLGVRDPNRSNHGGNKLGGLKQQSRGLQQQQVTAQNTGGKRERKASKKAGLWDRPAVDPVHNAGTSEFEPLDMLTRVTAKDLVSLATAVPKLGGDDFTEFVDLGDLGEPDFAPLTDEAGFDDDSADAKYDEIFAGL